MISDFNFAGVGVGMVLFSMLLSSYYSVVMSWAMLYLGSSFSSQLPWTHCNNTWNTEFCHQGASLRIIDGHCHKFAIGERKEG